MQRVTATLVLALLTVTVPQAALAQTDAKQAFEAGKTAYASEQFDKARESFIKASLTDVRNPEAFLWLGKAHYQLGELDKAVEAWRTTLRLAPNEPYAAKMLKALRGELTKVDTRIRLIEVLQNERLYSTVRQQCKTLLKDKALTDAQRAKVMMIQAAALLESNRIPDALTTLREVLLRYAAHADKAETTLLMGRIKLRMHRRDLPEALALFKKVLAEHPKTPAAVTAGYKLIRHRLNTKPNTANAQAMVGWITANPDHAMIREARHQLVRTYLIIIRQASVIPVRDAVALSDAEKVILSIATDIYKQAAPTDVTQTMRSHLSTYYNDHAPCPAAIIYIETLLKAPLPSHSRRQVLGDLARYRYNYAFKQLKVMVEANKLPAGAMPKVLADTVAVYAIINKEFPTDSAWKRQAILAGNVCTTCGGVPWPAKVTQPKTPYTWALEIALPVVKANADSSAVDRAVRVITNIVDVYARFHKPPARDMALATHTELLKVLSEKHSAWPRVMLRRIDLLSAYATDVFHDNLKEGKADANAKLTEHQKQILIAMTKLAGRQVRQAPVVLKRLETHLQPWVRYGHYALVEQAYAQLSAALPEAQKRPAQLAIAKLWVGQVAREHSRLLSAGLIVPRKLDPIHVKALERCYGLQAGLDEGNTSLVQARSVWSGIIEHYKRLEYFDIAAQAIKVKPAVVVDTANAYAQLQLAGLHYAQAQRELVEFLKQYKGRKKIALTPAFKTAIADYKKIISDRPSNPLAYQAVNRIFHMAQFFEQHQAYDVAAGVYRDFAAFAAKVKVLSQAAPGAVSTVEQAEFAAAGALYAKAQNALQKTIAEAKPQAAPPAKMSPEFTDAVGAYKTFIKDRPESALLGPAIRRIMSAALVYARADAWDVADTIYADLLKANLALRRPERIEFCRGLCQLGKVMPDHAKQVLAALAITGEDGKGKGRGTGIPSSGAMISKLAGGPLTSPRTEMMRVVNEMKPLTKRLEESTLTTSDQLDKGDMLAMVAIRKHQHRRASQIAMLRDRDGRRYRQPMGQKKPGKQKRIAAVPVLSDAEIARREKAFASAYEIFQAIRKNYARTPTARHARGEITVMISHWRTIAQWQRAAAMTEKFLTDNPTDKDLPQLRLSIARDYLAWAAKPVKKQPSKQEMLAEVAGRFDKTRARLAGIVKDFSEEKSIVHQAQWDIANSFLTQARVVDAFSPMLARGQYVRGAKELQHVAVMYHDHPNIASVPQMLWNVSGELAGRGYYEEAMTVWTDLTIHYPTHPLAQAAALQTAQTYQNNLARPLRAAEAYLELNFARGGSDQGIQNAIFHIGSKLKNEKRWVEALHVLETFVDSFPRHPSAGQALTMVGQIHQANEAWEDAIAAYRRVIDEFGRGKWIRDAKWAIAECTINLSRWREAMSAYQTYLAAYPTGTQAVEAKRRIGVLKDLARYQSLVDEKGQRKAFDAQYQIAEIVLTKLSNPVKAIIEYRKVARKWAKSHLADDAMFKIGVTYLAMGETTKAREALLAVAMEYPNSPLADDALYMVGKSYEKEATSLAGVTRAKTLRKAREFAQKVAYKQSQSARFELRRMNIDRIADLKKAGKGKLAEMAEARSAVQQSQYGMANAALFASQAEQQVQTLTAKQLADRQDKINAALRQAVGAYQKAAKVAAADKADDSLLRMAVIYAEKLKDSDAAMKTYLEIVRQFSGTAVAEDASWRIAQYYERERKYAEAITAYKAFLRNYRRSTRAGAAQFAVAENYEHIGKWVDAMDAYTNYINNFPSGPLVRKAKEQINWIKTYRL